MDDNKSNGKENQQPDVSLPADQPIASSSQEAPTSVSEKPQPIFETVEEHEAPQPIGEKPAPVSEEKQPVNQVEAQPEIQAEEVAETVSTPEEAASTPPPSPPKPPSIPVDHTMIKYALLGGAAGVFIMIFFFLVKFLLGGPVKKEVITLEYWGLWEEQQIMAPVIASYESQNPGIKVNYQKMSPEDYRDKVLARSLKGTGPDIFRFHNTWLPQISDVAAYVPENIMTAKEFENTFYPIHVKDLGLPKDVPGKPAQPKHYYGIPLQLDGLVLVYNNGLFKKAGITSAPKTWDQIGDYANKIVSKDKNGQIITSPIAIGTASNVEHFSDIFGLMLVQNGGDLQNLGSPEAAGALEAYRKLAEAPKAFWDDTMPNSVAAFEQEKVAMIIIPSWQILEIKAVNPDIDMKVVSVPQLPEGNPISISTYWVEGVSRKSKHQVEAWKFLKYLSQKDVMSKLYEAQSKTRLFGEAYSRVDLGSTLAQNEYLGPVIAQAPNYVSMPLIARTHDGETGMNTQIVKYIENAINATIQGSSYTEAINVAAQGVSQVFKTFKVEQ